MLTADELAGMRDCSASAQPDEVTIVRPGAVGALDDETGQYDDPAPAVVYEGPGRLRPGSSTANDVEQQGDAQLTVDDYVLTIPAGEGPVQVGDTATIAGQTGTWRVVKVPDGSWQIDQRLGVEEITGG